MSDAGEMVEGCSSTVLNRDFGKREELRLDVFDPVFRLNPAAAVNSSGEGSEV